MKRTPMPPRKTPMAPGKALKRASFRVDARAAQLKRSAELAPKAASAPRARIKAKPRPKMTEAQAETMNLAKRLIGCAACRCNLGVSNLVDERWQATLLPLEGHHILSGGRRIGHDFVLILCAWHHQGTPVEDLGKRATARLYGPSVALEKRRFVECYGTELDLLYGQRALLKRLTTTETHA